MEARDCESAADWSLIHDFGKRGLIALQNPNCTTVGGEFDLGEALADGAEQAVAEFGLRMMLAAVSVGLQEIRGLIVDGAAIGLRIQVEGVCAGEANFHEAAAAVHGVQAGADEVAVIKDVAGGGHEIDVGKGRLKDLRAAADGVEFELAGAESANQGATGGLDNDVAGDFLEVDIAGDALQLHVAIDLLDQDEAGLGAQLQFGLFRNEKLKIGFDFMRLRRR